VAVYPSSLPPDIHTPLPLSQLFRQQHDISARPNFRRGVFFRNDRMTFISFFFFVSKFEMVEFDSWKLPLTAERALGLR